MKKHHYLVVGLVSIVVAIAAFVARSESEEATPDATQSTSGLNAAETAAGREAAERMSRMSPAAARSSVGKFSAATLQATEDKFRRMIAVRGLITQDKERSALAKTVIAMPDGAELMRMILLDPAFARNAFGDFQAEARFYAITVLEEMARDGKLDFVVDVAADLAKQLSAVTGEMNRGRAEDLRGIAIVLGRTLGSQGLQDAKSPVLAKLGFGPGLAEPVHQLYVEGMFYGVWKAESVERAMDALKTL